MESRGMRARGSAIALALALLWSVAFASASAGGIVVYWGQNGDEVSLKETCETKNFEIVIIAFLYKFGNGQKPEINLANHCYTTTVDHNCHSLNTEIKSCQESGVKMFLSLGGSTDTYSIVSAEDAEDVAKYLWDNFLGGNTGSGPFGDAVLDGIDFDIEHTTENWDLLAEAIYAKGKAHSNSKKVYLSAAPQCPRVVNNVENLLIKTLQTKRFDYVWIQFYNNRHCDYTEKKISTLVDAWNEWTESETTLQPRGFYLGLPATPAAAGGDDRGYIDPDTLKSVVLPKIRKSSKYGGVMLWSKYWDEQTTPHYSDAIKDTVKIKLSLADEPTLASF